MKKILMFLMLVTLATMMTGCADMLLDMVEDQVDSSTSSVLDATEVITSALLKLSDTNPTVDFGDVTAWNTNIKYVSITNDTGDSVKVGSLTKDAAYYAATLTSNNTTVANGGIISLSVEFKTYDDNNITQTGTLTIPYTLSDNTTKSYIINLTGK